MVIEACQHNQTKKAWQSPLVGPAVIISGFIGRPHQRSSFLRDLLPAIVGKGSERTPDVK
jgi:hypothetical protein